MIVRKTYAGRVCVLCVGVGVQGKKLWLGIAEDVERAWLALQKKFDLHRRPPCQRTVSSSELDKLQRAYSRRTSNSGAALAKFRGREKDAAEAETEDVFSPNWQRPKFNKNDPRYGRPKEGSLTEQRGISAGHHIGKEIITLCEIIDENGARAADGSVTISFGRLFDIYTFISDKVVGMLLRARKHRLVSFEGEMLYQRRDDTVPITLLVPLAVVKRAYTETDDPKSVLANFTA